MFSIRNLTLLAAFAFALNAFAADKKKAAPAPAAKPVAAPAAPAAAPAAAAPAAQPRKQSLHEQYSGAGYGVAGCGLGSVVFGAKPGMIQIVAATLNYVGTNQSLGITSGTSNCEIPQMGQQAARFIEVNREIVMKDAARGNGETIAGLSEIYGCKDTTLFSTKVQKNYELIFKSTNAYDNSREILNTIKNNQDLKASCATLS